MTVKEVDDEFVHIFESSMRLGGDVDYKNAFKRNVVPPILASLECPFSWQYEFPFDHHDIVDRIEQKLSEIKNEDDELLPWKLFVLNLILCYEYAKSGDLEDAKEKQMVCEEILNSKCVDEDCPSAPAMGCGLRHISLACKCFLLHASQLHDEVVNTANMIVPFEDLTTRDKASILCMKGAYCAEFGFSGIKESVAIIEIAVLMDKECAEWSFLLGRSLSRLRRLEKRSAIPDQKELKALERAVELSDNVCFMVLLAQSYRETAHNIYNEKRRELNSFKPFCDSLNQKAVDLYRKVCELRKDNVHVLVRCALGLMKLPKPWKNLDMAQTCILKALDIAPKHCMANHVAGTYYSSVKDYKLALEYFSKASACGAFGADIDLISLKRKLNESYIPIADLERLLDIYKEKPYRESTLCHLGAYFYNVENDFKKALKYWSQVIEMDINSEKLKRHYDSISARHPPMKVNNIVISEIMKLLDTRDVSESERQSYNKIISKYIEYHPGLIRTLTNINMSRYKNRAFEHRVCQPGALGTQNVSSGNSGLDTSGSWRKNATGSSNSNSASCSRSPFHGSGSACMPRARGWGEGRGGGRGTGGHGVTKEHPSSEYHQSNTGAIRKRTDFPEPNRTPFNWKNGRGGDKGRGRGHGVAVEHPSSENHKSKTGAIRESSDFLEINPASSNRRKSYTSS